MLPYFPPRTPTTLLYVAPWLVATVQCEPPLLDLDAMLGFVLTPYVCRDVLKLHETRFADPSQASAVSVGRQRVRCCPLLDLLLRLCHGPCVLGPPLLWQSVYSVWPVHLCCVASAGGAEAGAGEQGGQGHGPTHRAGHSGVAWPREGGICVASVSAVLS